MDLGYRVLCIDKAKHYTRTTEFTMNMPENAEDFTADRPLLERADMLCHADFFIGLSSGLSWLAYTADCPVIMIAGFTMCWSEFPTPYRVYNKLVCTGCYNDLRINWQGNGCERHWAGSPEILQCSKKITPRMVIQAIDRLIADKKAGRLNQSPGCI
jgi:autotransporter strand-loop-strand O-heptosyltransferase